MYYVVIMSSLLVSCVDIHMQYYGFLHYHIIFLKLWLFLVNIGTFMFSYIHMVFILLYQYIILTLLFYACMEYTHIILSYCYVSLPSLKLT